MKGKIFIISGPSGSGKTTLYKNLLNSPKLKNKLFKSVSVTTRPMRNGESHGRDYFFVSPKMFLYQEKAGHFLESEKVFGNHYGTPRRYVHKLLKEGKNVLLCIDVKGANTVLKKFPNAVTIFIKTPSMQILRKRLRSRGAEAKREIDLRLKTAQWELREAKNYKYIVINDDLNASCRKLESIVMLEILSDKNR